jgi:hypothetical protein
MSYQKGVTIYCDNFIGEEENQCCACISTPYSDVRGARSFAKKNGWKCDGEWDYCPQCKEELEKDNN